MQEKKRELLDNLKVVRTFDIEDEGMRELVASIQKAGQKAPLLVFQDGTTGHVIDGAKRVSALRILGREAVDILVENDLIEVVEIFGQAAHKKPITMDRAVDFLTAISPFTGRRGTRPGGRARWEELHPELVDGRHQWGRQMMAYGTGGILSPSAGVRVLHLITQAAIGDQLAKTSLEQIRAEVITPHQGILAMERTRPQLKGSTTSAADQLRILTHGVDNLLAAVSAFQTLGSPLRVAASEVETAIAKLQRARGETYALIRGLTKEMNRKENSGS